MPVRLHARALAAALVLTAAAAVLPPAAHAQTPAPAVERPVAFDAGGRVAVLTPALVARLRLAAPTFPVQGPFAEARLFATDVGATGPAVLSVVRPGGAVERYTLDADQRSALAGAITAGLAAAGSGLRDSAVVVSGPAGRAFVRNQTALGLLLYGPATAGLVSASEESVALAYAAGAGAAFATSLAIARQRPVTRAQAILSGSAAIGGAATGAGLLALARADEGRGYAGAILAGAVGGSILGFQRARGMTDAEASSSASAALLGALTAVGTAGALGAYEGGDDRARLAVAGGLAALGTGYALGPRYARTRRYTVTAGDVGVLTPTASTGAALGAAVGWAASDGDAQATWLGATAGFVTGGVLGDRLLVRRLDHTPAEADLVRLGTLVGAGIGGALASAADVRTAAGLTLTGVGGLAGLAFAEAVLKPASDGLPGRLRTSLHGTPLAPLAEPGRLRVSPSGLALARLTAARGGRGTFPVLALTF